MSHVFNLFNNESRITGFFLSIFVCVYIELKIKKE
jgi:hypothetical protein